MTGLRIELRRGPGLWLSLVLLGAGLFYVATDLRSFSVWADSSQAMANAPFLMAPVAAGTAAWAGARGRRRQTWHHDRLGARGPLAGGAAEMAALALWALASYLALVVSVSAVTAAQASWGGPSLLWIAAAGSGLGVCVPIGWLVGRLVPLRFTAPVVAMVVFGGAGWADSVIGGHDWWGRLLPVGVFWHLVPYSEVREPPLIAEIVFDLGVAAGVFLVLGLAWGDRLRRVAAVGTAMLAAVSLAIGLLVADGGYFDRRSPEPVFLCEGDDPEVCVHPAYAAFAPDLQARTRDVTDRLRSTPFAFSRAEQWQEHPPTPNAVPFGFDYPLPIYIDVAAQDMATEALRGGGHGGGVDACYAALDADPSAPALVSIELMFILIEWVATGEVGGAGAHPGDGGPRQWLAGQTTPAMQEWISRHADEIRDCSLAPEDFA